MADGKYGRLFTERDVLAIVDEALMAGSGFDRLDVPLQDRMHAILEQLIERAEADKAPMTFPADEPLFLLRAEDKAAARVALRYPSDAQDAGATPEFVSVALVAAERLGRWQQHNPDRVKAPD